ncbi:DUF2267 domain-containing protein [Natronorubrum daqingense]|uniref:Uncharacterized conserved protein, DUF2267 family n=1 Tax=Natronorubrum daqingense TaxID=588898 RepID=A0A1N7DWV7_9EURY|nr:DUF2267 domain-containing protein [Natronorubrum daqingense]APX96226.1 hypothetical protein BB347_06075 [Natronorubrum daqingense]SIR80316.1 Uncharacterized conserved protein, DUF2267 family [Natronorubrum daqingense]
MQYDNFIGEVQHRAQLDSREAALSVSRATLTTLSERIQPGEAENLGAQLPEELGRFLEEVDDVEQFAFDEFVDRVADREEIGNDDPADAAFHAQVVLDVVEEAVSVGALEDVKTQLPMDEGYDELFEIAESEGSPA